jgi:hypothetical protein
MDAEGGVDALEQQLLSSLRPDDEARSKVWQTLAQEAGLAAGVSAGAGSAAVTKSAAASALVGKGALPFLGTQPWLGTIAGKLLVVGALAAPLAVAAVYWGAPKEKASSASSANAALASDDTKPEAARSTAPLTEHDAAPVVAATEAAQAGPAQVGPELAGPELADAGGDPSSTRATDSASPRIKETVASALAEENRLLLEARSALRSGGGAAALRALSVLDRRHPRGALLQERELLRIQALRASGSLSEASKLSARFLERWPESPYRATVRSFAESP